MRRHKACKSPVSRKKRQNMTASSGISRGQRRMSLIVRRSFSRISSPTVKWLKQTRRNFRSCSLTRPRSGVRLWGRKCYGRWNKLTCAKKEANGSLRKRPWRRHHLEWCQIELACASIGDAGGQSKSTCRRSKVAPLPVSWIGIEIAPQSRIAMQ